MAKSSKHGRKTKAGILLSKYIKKIAHEETEFVKSGDGDDRMVTKAEALARVIWKLALGYEETVIKILKSGERSEVIKPYGPNSTYIGIILDRTEGRAPLMADGKDGRLSVADRVSAEGKNRINNIISDRKK